MAEDFSDEIIIGIDGKDNGTEPEWFLKEMWPEDERFVFEMSQLIDETANQAAWTSRRKRRCCAFICGDTEGLERI